MPDDLQIPRRINLGIVMIATQTMAGVIAVTMLYSQLSNAAANSKETAERLEKIVDRQQTNTETLSTRLTKVETTLGAVTDTVARIDNKVDAIRSTQIK